MHHIRKLILITLPFLLVGCGLIQRTPSIQNRDEHYLFASNAAPLETPQGIPSNALQNKYPVTDKQYPYSERRVSLVPPGL